MEKVKERTFGEESLESRKGFSYRNRKKAYASETE